MTVSLPEPVPLEPPPGDPGAVEDLAAPVYGAVFCLGVLETALAGPAGSAPNWRGDDAVAAAVRVDAVTTLARESCGALSTAAGRLAQHRDRLREARDRTAALVAQQDEDYRAAWARLHAMPDVVPAMRTDSAAATAVAEEFAAAEAARRREHAALLEEIAADATATGRVLAECSAVAGGTGRTGDAERAVAHLAAALPGWGAVEMAARGAALADELALCTPDERARLAGEVLPFAAHPEFAAALLAGIGVDGVQTTLLVLGQDGRGGDSALARMLAATFGAASESTAGPVREVLEARYVDPDDLGVLSDEIALGMGAVLAASVAGRPGGLTPPTVLDWGRQLLAREAATRGSGPGGRAIDRADAPHFSGDVRDPLELVAEHLARDDDPASAAALLAERSAWEGLLARRWDDGGAAFSALIERAAEDASGEVAVRAGLETLGAGLDDHDPDGWLLHRDTAGAVAPALGNAVAAHVTVALDALSASGTGPADTSVLRGLGLVTLDLPAAVTVGTALVESSRPEGLTVEVPAAYLAVLQYGLELEWTLNGFEAKAEADRRELAWNVLVGWTGYLPGPFGKVAGVTEGPLAQLLGMDGVWENPPAPGEVYGSADAMAGARAGLGPGSSEGAAEVVRVARAAYTAVADRLGHPAPPPAPGE